MMLSDIPESFVMLSWVQDMDCSPVWVLCSLAKFQFLVPVFSFLLGYNQVAKGYDIVAVSSSLGTCLSTPGLETQLHDVQLTTP
jgi:hypothetical protein